MPTFSEDKRWIWDYSAERWIPANQVEKITELNEREMTDIVIEPGEAMAEGLDTRQEDWDGTKLKLLAILTSIFLPGIDYTLLGSVSPRKTKQIWLGIGIFFVFSILLGSIFCAPIALIIWLHGMATVAMRARDRVEELGGYTNDITGRRIRR